jgi:hypothetical protein
MAEITPTPIKISSGSSFLSENLSNLKAIMDKVEIIK